MIRWILLVVISCFPTLAQTPAPEADIVLRALNDELERSRGLSVVSLEKPYYIEYGIHEAESFSVSATLGAVNSIQRGRGRVPRIQVRVGDYAFDNSNYVRSDVAFSGRYDLGPCPVDDSYMALRQYFWLATDSAYKSALEAISRKRAAQKNVTVTEQLPDFGKAAPAVMYIAASRRDLQDEPWKSRVRRLSGLFTPYRDIVSSSADFFTVQGHYYLVTSEGSRLKVPERSTYFQARAAALAADGMTLRDAVSYHALNPDDLPPETEIRRGVSSVAENLEALLKAPTAEPYTGPVLFEPYAAAQLMAELLGRNLALRRRPVPEPGRPVPFMTSELEGRLGSRILPEWMDVVDDPTANEWRGRPLLGHYTVDLEGVIPKPVTLVEKGLLKSYLSTRQPTKGGGESNGRARLRGSYGANAATLSNLFIRVTASSTLSELKMRLMELARQREKPYGLIIRKMDFPSSASVSEAQRLLAQNAQDGASARPISLPTLAYRVYSDGREELIRGLRFKDVTLRSLREILAAGGDPAVLEYLENGAPFALLGASSYVAESAVISPGMLFEELQLVHAQDELPRLPVVPPPSPDSIR